MMNWPGEKERCAKKKKGEFTIKREMRETYTCKRENPRVDNSRSKEGDVSRPFSAAAILRVVVTE